MLANIENEDKIWDKKGKGELGRESSKGMAIKALRVDAGALSRNLGFLYGWSGSLHL